MLRVLALAFTVAFSAAGLAGAQDGPPDDPGFPNYQPRDGEVVAFDVYRGRSDFGVHEVRFSREGGDLLTETRIRLRAGFGPITVFRYEHDARARWNGDTLVSMTSRTLKDGDTFEIDARMEDGALVTSGVAEDGREIAERFTSAILPSSHWHAYPLAAERMLNTETGEAMDIQVSYVGREEIEADGGMIMADRYRLEGSLALDLWYDEDGRWAACAFDARGQSIRYVRRADPVSG